MGIISSILFRRNVEVEATGTIINQATEKALIGKVNDFFTGNVNYLIIACLVYFTLCAGFTRMKNKHMAVLVPTAAVWTVLQAKALIGMMAAGTAILALAKAYFAFQGTSAAEDVRDSAQGLVSGGIASVVQAVKGSSTGLSSEATQLVQDHIPSSRESTGTRSPSLQERAQELLPTQTSTKETAKLFERTNAEQIVPPTSTLVKSPVDLDEDLYSLYQESFSEIPQSTAPISWDNLADEFLAEYETPQLGSTTNMVKEFESFQAPQLPQMTAVFDEAWDEVGQPEALDQLKGVKQGLLDILPKEQFNAYEQICKGAKIKFPNANPGDNLVQEFLAEQCKSKGLPWNKIGKAAGGVLVTALAAWGAYKVWEDLNAPEEDDMHTMEVKETKTPEAQEDSTESGVIGWFGSVLTALIPEDDGYYSGGNDYQLFGATI